MKTILSSTKRMSVSLSVFLLIALANAAAQEIDRVELDRSGSVSINFINYEGPHARIESRNSIRAIGYELGLAIRNGAKTAGDPRRYFVAHSVSPSRSSRLDADIFGLGVDAGVDHIRNLRLILQGYLEGAYGYSASDGALLARFITVYNAVYRGDLINFAGRYADSVVSGLTKEKVGLSIRFDEWPGRSSIVLPLATGVAGSLSAVDSSSIADRKVTEELRKDPDLGVDVRKEMVELKERESEEAAQTAAFQREAIAEEEAKLKAEKSALEAEKAAVEAGKAKAEADRKRLAETKQVLPAEKPAATDQKGATSVQGGTAAKAETQAESTQKEKALAAEEEALKQREKDLAAKEETLAAKKESIEEKKQEAAAMENLAEKKAEEAKEERSGIAQDQQSIIKKQEAEKTASAGIIAFRMTSAQSPLGSVVRLDPLTGKVLEVSPLDTVNARTVTVIEGSIVAVAGKAQGSGAIRLVSLDPETLEMAQQGEDDIHADSLLWVNGKDLYALTSSEGKLHLGRFDLDLKRAARSIVEIHPFASISFRGEALVTQRSDGSAAMLNPQDLTEKK